MQHETMGQDARFERFVAEILFTIASGVHIDPDLSHRFSEQIDDIYRNPFDQKKKPMTTEEIKQYILKKLEET